MNYDGVEAESFCLGGGLVGVFSLGGRHWNCFSSWYTMGATVGIFAPEGSLDTKQTKEIDCRNGALKDLRIITQSKLFSNDQKVITVEKTGGIYTPTLAVFLHSCPYIFTLCQYFQNP